MKYAYAFPGVAQPPTGMPQGAEWDQLYRGAHNALGVSAVRDVVVSSYDRVLIDEYQDCHRLQHALAVELSSIVPTLIFGDPMQGIFEFAGATLRWDGEIHEQFPLADTLETPYRWEGKNPGLGQWIAETRVKLLRGEPIDLHDPRIIFRESNDAFDMGTLFEGIDGKEGSFAAIHCRKGLCYQLAKAANGGYQAIEEVAAARLQQFAEQWDSAADGVRRQQAIRALLADCFQRRERAQDDQPDAETEAVRDAIRQALPSLGEGNGAAAAVEIMRLSRRMPFLKLYRGELWRDAEKSATELVTGRAECMLTATSNIRQRSSKIGRKLPKRTVSTPLLLKGLEFDHVVIPDARHFSRETRAQAKLFYVAISRATRSLTISSSDRWLQLPAPSL
ncbi:hypothetical protein THUN1379_21090 [Paludibacterium sp. THUN1379]|nr:hypothetical protein THUN1379_21090 [Paludibacterium sp. THUN1379]